ncbi:hypothetical protein [Nesterenkonia lacusekhoensis]|uniref:hypothetical protein n=1 Tax=Nesterenkonia lacusekhoensis TaxID=150832 RepID=UPI001AE25158|nr:hypothetical protein [Nesterenkonia lacusekhoensis]
MTVDEPARPMIALHGVSKAYPARDESRTVRALHEITLSIRAGEILGVVGQSGSGKWLIADEGVVGV